MSGGISLNDIYIILPFIQFVVSLFLASLVIFSAPRSTRNRIFAAFLMAMSAWGIAIFGMRDAFPNAATGFAWEKIALAVIPFSSIVFFHFVREYTGVPRTRLPLLLFYTLGFASAGLSLNGQVAVGVTEKFYGFAPEPGWAMPLFLATAYVPVVWAIFILTHAMELAPSKVELTRIRLLWAGALMSAAGGASDLLPAVGVNIYPLGVIGNLGFGVITTYAVTRHRLMDLRLVLRHGLAYTALSAMIFAVYGVALAVAFLFARNLSTAAGIVTAVGAVFLASVFVQPLVGRLQRFVDRLFFRERYDRLESLLELSEVTRDITDFQALADGLIRIVRRTIQADWVVMILPDHSGHTLVPMASSRDNAPELTVSTHSTLSSWFRRYQQPLRHDEINLDPYLQAMSDTERRAIDEAAPEIMVPMLSKDQLTGIIALGPKLAAEDYTAEDIVFLSSVADRSATVIDNSRMYALERERLDELERLDSLKSNLLLTVSHELKSPLTAIKTSVDLLQMIDSNGQEENGDASSTASPHQKVMRTLTSGVSRLEQLTQESLDYAAMQSANLQLNMSQVDLSELVEEASALFQAGMRAKGQQFTVSAADGLPRIYGDGPRLERIVANVLSNAHKFTPPGGEIRVEIKREGNSHVLQVIDSGPGIPEDEQELVFNPYYRSKNADGRRDGGTGLGLSIARYLAELHGGTLTLQSQPGEGTTFTLRLPSVSRGRPIEQLAARDLSEAFRVTGRAE
ncbi:MAG: ATP-binding protein [Chloroflexota bacterium]